MHKTKILAVVPSENIRTFIDEVVSSRNDVKVDTFVASLYSGAELAEQKSSGYDIVIARGETAAMIHSVVTIPVVDIPFSFYDVLHATRLADNFNLPYAIVGFTSVTSIAHMLRELLQLKLDIFTLYELDEAPSLIQELKDKGYRLIVSGMGTDHIVRRSGMNSILITTGKDSVATAIGHAVNLCTSLVKEKQKNQFLSEIVTNSCEEVLIFNASNAIIYSTIQSLDKEMAMSLAVKELQTSFSGDSETQKFLNDKTVKMKRLTIPIQNETYTAFYFQVNKTAYVPQKNEIRVFSKDSAVDTFLRHFPESANSANGEGAYDQLASMSCPVMLFGETGTGKEQIAATIYTKGALQNYPYYVIDFDILDDKAWKYIISSPNSPLMEKNNTIFFRKIDRLSFSKIDKLRTVIVDSMLCERARVLFSCTTVPGGKIPTQVIELMNTIGCQTVRLVPLRKRVSEFHMLLSLYINTANFDCAKQVIGLSQAAKDLMAEYQWPDNLTQFKRVVTQLVSSSLSPYIQEEQVKKVLEEENLNLKSSAALSSVINLTKSLKEIEKDVARAVLLKTNGNQSQAAIKLGISRTTFWRMLNR